MSKSRIAPVETPLQGEDARRMAKLIPATMSPPQLYLIAARHAKLWAFWVDSGLIGPTGLMDLKTLPGRLREIVILRTCVGRRCDYEFNLHVQTVSERMGLTLRQIEDLKQVVPAAEIWSASELAAILLVDALVHRLALTDAEFDLVRAQHSDEALIEMTQLVGLYTSVAMLVTLAGPAFDLYRFPSPILSTPTVHET